MIFKRILLEKKKAGCAQCFYFSAQSELCPRVYVRVAVVAAACGIECSAKGMYGISI